MFSRSHYSQSSSTISPKSISPGDQNTAEIPPSETALPAVVSPDLSLSQVREYASGAQFRLVPAVISRTGNERGVNRPRCGRVPMHATPPDCSARILDRSDAAAHGEARKLKQGAWRPRHSRIVDFVVDGAQGGMRTCRSDDLSTSQAEGQGVCVTTPLIPKRRPEDGLLVKS